MTSGSNSHIFEIFVWLKASTCHWIMVIIVIFLIVVTTYPNGNNDTRLEYNIDTDPKSNKKPLMNYNHGRRIHRQPPQDPSTFKKHLALFFLFFHLLLISTRNSISLSWILLLEPEALSSLYWWVGSVSFLNIIKGTPSPFPCLLNLSLNYGSSTNSPYF